MGKKDVTDWSQKGNQTVRMQDGKAAVNKFRDTAGKAGLLMCAAAVIAVLAKAVKNGGLEEYQDEKFQDSEAEKPADSEPEHE